MIVEGARSLDNSDPNEAPGAVVATRRVRWVYPIAVGLPLIVLNCGWIANSEMKTGVTEITISTLFIGVLFILFVVTLLNLLLRRQFGPSASLNQPELMTLYTMLSVSSAVAGIGNYGFLMPFLAAPFRDMSGRSPWHALWYLLPPELAPRNASVLRGFYQGHSSILDPGVLSAWTLPLIFWGGFFLTLLWTMLCLAVIVRQRWAAQEHLPFPVLALPLEMTRDGAPIYRNPFLWLGFTFPAVLYTINTLHTVFPSLPWFPLNQVHEMAANLPPPWSGIDDLPLLLHPSGVGFGYLINTGVSFSLWFFYLLNKALNVVGVTFGWRVPAQGDFGSSVAQFPFTGYQGIGAWVALALGTLWIGRVYYLNYLAEAFSRRKTKKDNDESMSPRIAVLGAMIGFTLLCAFVWSWGGSFWLPIAFLGVYLLLMLALSRLQAETAVVSPYLVWINPQTIITSVVGTTSLSHLDTVHTGMLSRFNLDYRAAPMPQELQRLVGVRRAGGSLRPIIAVIMLAVIVAIISASLWDLQLYYANGASTGNVNQYRINMGTAPWWTIVGWLRQPKIPDPKALIGASAGAAITVALSLLRSNVAGFRLSPEAYVLNTSWANDLFWCDIFVAWLLKSLILRYGGMRLYRRMMPLFLGLILGDFVTGSVWSIVGTLMHLDLYRTFAN